MLRRLYDWTMQLAAHRHAPWALARISFAESSVFPIPPDIMLIPMVLAERLKAWAYASIATAAREQTTGLGEINSAVNQMDQVTQQNAAMVEEATAVMHKLAGSAQKLAGMVDQFDIGSGHDAQRSAPRRGRAA